MKHPNILICSAEDALKFVMPHFSDPKAGRAPQITKSYATISIQDPGDITIHSSKPTALGT